MKAKVLSTSRGLARVALRLLLVVVAATTAETNHNNWNTSPHSTTRFLLNNNNNNSNNNGDATGTQERWQQAVQLLASVGLQPCRHRHSPKKMNPSLDDLHLYHVASEQQQQQQQQPEVYDIASAWLPLCPLSSTNVNAPLLTMEHYDPLLSPLETPRHLRQTLARRRHLEQDESTPPLTENEPQEENPDEVMINFVGAFVCVSVAALAAGLTLGMLGLDPLMLLIKERASDNPTERAQAKQLLPLVKQHHRLLVTLLLMNSIANEALPIFLEALVPPSVAILVSVTLVLFFGEIIPSAVFTGPNQLRLASALVPVVRVALFCLAPLAWPIAKLLDCILHGDDDDNDHGGTGTEAYKRGELSALIRIQYEERLATKRKRRQQRQEHRTSVQVGQLKGESIMGSLDFTQTAAAAQEKHQNVKAIKSHLQHTNSMRSSRSSSQAGSSHLGGAGNNSLRLYESGPGTLQRSDSLHGDEVIMIEGALQMKTNVAIDVYTPLRRMFAVPGTLALTEKAMVQIYASGFSRVPVYRPNPDKPKDKTAIQGILLIKQLIVLNPDDARPILSMPLYTPFCVSPQTPLVELVNLFQTGGKALKGGHLALVCARPREGNLALASGKPLPESAGLMGIITLEDVLECLLQEQIYDENDRYELNAVRLAKYVISHWKRYVRRKKQGNPMKVPQIPNRAMAAVVEDLMDEQHRQHPDENTGLLA